MTKRICFPLFRSIALLALIAAFSIPLPASAATSPWQMTGSLNVARYAHSAVLLADGRVLVVGGQDTTGEVIASAELYDPAVGTWTLTGSMHDARAYLTATLLPNGEVLVAGGQDASGNGEATAELYEPATGQWTVTGSMTQARSQQIAVRLPSGDVLVAGGWAPPSTAYGLTSAEIYHPANGTWTVTASMTVGRADPVGILLTSGTVLVAGGVTCCPYATSGRDVTELYDPVSQAWTTTGSMTASRYNTKAITLADGRVLVPGGTTGTVQPNLHASNTSDAYDPTAGLWTATGPMTSPRERFGVAVLADGRVLAAGGRTEPTFGTGATLRTAELFSPTTNTWQATASLSTARAYLPATRLADGCVLVAGGVPVIGSPQALASAELFTPPPGLTLSPATGPRGTKVNVSGVAFRSSKTIYLTFNGIQLPRTCATDATGSFSNCTLFVPILPAGQYPVSASDGSDYAQATFTIRP